MSDMQDQEAPVPGLQRLRQDVLPARDLWAGIQPRLKPRRNYAPWAGMALAASLMLGLAINVQQAAQVLEPAAQLAASSASPDLRSHDRALVKANLKIVNDAEKQLLDALKRHPDSRSLKRLLDSNQQKRRDLRRMLNKAPV